MTQQPDDPPTGSRTPPPDGAPQQPPPTPVRLRRAPRYRAFVLTGVVAGVVLAGVLSVLLPGGTSPSGRSPEGYLVALLALLGGVVGAAVAVLVERPRRGGR